MDQFNFDFEGYRLESTRKRRAARTRWQKHNGELLLKALLNPASRTKPDEHMKGLLDDLLTDKEWERLAMRIEAAKLLFMGAPFSVVVGMTGISNDALSSLSKKMFYKTYGLSETMSDLRRNEISEQHQGPRFL